MALVANVIDNIDINSGGPSLSIVAQLIEIQNLSSLRISLFTGASPDPIILNDLNLSIKFYNYGVLNRFLRLNKDFSSLNIDVFHGHGIWKLPVHQMAAFARKHKIPYLLSPHGMLEPWALSHKFLKKQFALTAFQKKDLNDAFCIHVTSMEEMSNLRRLGLKPPIALIPNGIDLKPFNSSRLTTSTKYKVLFLSRIHKVKGIENLLYAWSLLPDHVKANSELDIVGMGEESYRKHLIGLINSLDLDSNVRFLGPLFGEMKYEILRNADIFVLPTFSENFGMVVTEALASGVPVITTKGAPWVELEEFNAGWWINIGIEPLKNALLVALTKSKKDLRYMGNNGRRLIEEKYNINISALRMIDLYNWTARKIERPDFIFD
jgi:glycosyltransferase involved in cell wall biosynthesis